MAKSSYRKRMESVSNKEEKSTSDKLASQLKNYQTRAESVGVEKDTRNPLEKLLNLKEDQNVLFDIAEVLNRPQQAIFRGIESAQEGGDFLEGMRQGFGGVEETNFGDILRNAGVDDTPLFQGPISGEDRSIADIFGLAGDIFLDPMDIIPVAGFKNASKLLDEGASLREASKVLKSVNDVGFELVGKGAKKGLGVADNLVEKGLQKSDNKAFREGLQQMAEDLNIVDKGTKLSDDALDALEKEFRNIGYDLSNLGTDKAGVYNSIKRSLRKTKNYKEGVPGNIIEDINRMNNNIDAANDISQGMMKDYNDRLVKYITETNGVKAEEITDDMRKAVNKNIELFLSSKYAPEDNLYRYLNEAVAKGKSEIKGSEKYIDKLQALIEKVKTDNDLPMDMLNPKKIRNADGTFTLRVTKENSKNLADFVKDNSKRGMLESTTFRTHTELDEATKEARRALKDKYKTDKGFKELVDSAEPMYKDYASTLKKFTDDTIDYTPIAREGYNKLTYTEEGKLYKDALKQRNINLGMDEVVQGNKNLYGAKKMANEAEMANIQAEQGRLSKIAGKQKSIEKAELQTHAAQMEATKSQIDSITNKIKEVEEAGANKISNIEKNIKLKDETIANLNKKKDTLNDVINDEVIKKCDSIYQNKQNMAMVKSLSNEYERYGKNLQQLKDIEKQLSKSGLTAKKYASLENKYNKLMETQDKISMNLLTKSEKVMGAADQQFISKAGKIANDIAKTSADTSSKLVKTQSEGKKLLETKKAISQATEDNLIKLREVQKGLEAKYSRLSNMTAEEIAKQDKYVLDRVGSLQKDIDLLESMEGKKLFSESFMDSFNYYVNSTSKEAKKLNAYNTILLHAGLNNEDLIRFVPKGQGAGKIQSGFKRLSQSDANSMLAYLEKNKEFLGDEGKRLIKELKQRISSSSAIVMDKDAYNMLMLNLNESEMNGLLKIFDTFNNNFKKFKTTTLGTQFRNVTGNSFNMWASGVSPIDMTKAYTQADKFAKSGYVMNLAEKAAKGTLSATEKADYEIAKKIIEGGFLGQGKEVQDIADLFKKATTDNESKNLLKKAWDGLFSTSVKANEWVDNRNRIALLIHAEKHPGYLARNGFKDSIDAVSKVLFDPNNLSPFEKNVMKRIMPFYTFAKQNMMFQMSNAMKNSSKYKRLIKVLNKTYETAGEDSYRDYQKENMELPIFKSGDGNLVSLKANLPANDLAEILSDPVSKFVNMQSQLIKTPYEMVTGKDTFTGQDINRTPMETLANIVGIDTLTTSQYNKLQNLREDIQNGAEASKVVTDILPSVVRYTDSEKVANSNMYDELQQYQEMFKQLKSQGIDIPTINDLKNSSKSSLRNLQRKRAKQKRSR